jgi:hypothetical protein
MVINASALAALTAAHLLQTAPFPEAVVPDTIYQANGSVDLGLCAAAQLAVDPRGPARATPPMVVSTSDEALRSDGWVGAFIASRPSHADITRSYGLVIALAIAPESARRFDEACSAADARPHLPSITRTSGRDRSACSPSPTPQPSAPMTSVAEGIRFLDQIITDAETELTTLQSGVGRCDAPAGAWLAMADKIYKLRIVRQVTVETNPGAF